MSTRRYCGLCDRYHGNINECDWRIPHSGKAVVLVVILIIVHGVMFHNNQAYRDFTSSITGNKYESLGK